ncbi:MAG TPA: hypothetical protein DDW65_16860, partial [Firmicutes bacterium]|nr:hypothetical protein [Bacillota bacterium]
MFSPKKRKYDRGVIILDKKLLIVTNGLQRLSLKVKILVFMALILFLAILTVGFYSYSIAVDQVV